MGKASRRSPTSIRLSPESERYVSDMQAATGWSVSKVLEHLVMLSKQILEENHAGTKLIKGLMRVAADAHARITIADAAAAAARSEVRKAAAAVKEAR